MIGALEKKMRSGLPMSQPCVQEKAGLLAIRLGVDPEKSCAVLERARGNSHALYEYLAQAVPEFGPMALELAHVLPAKDLIDTNADTLLIILKVHFPMRSFIHRNSL